MWGTRRRITACAGCTPKPGLSGSRRSSAWAATRSSMASPLAAFSTTVRAFRAAVMPIEPWSSRAAADDQLARHVGLAVALGEDQRVVSRGVGLGGQRLPHESERVARRAVHLRRAAQAVRILHLVAVRPLVAALDLAVAQERPQLR